MSNGSEPDVSESVVVDTGNTSCQTTTTHGESDTFDDDDINLSSLSDPDEDYYQKNQYFVYVEL